ncbi:MAG: RagB/SusD family nutrient uptake outer membrane protein [Phaeodactylibacter sp.]|nr:RagB/SusD family nutrient uptake outer membrane protein [Phaeodactylibacter sp.]
MKNILTLFSAMALIFLSACDDDLLLTPPSSLSVESFFKSEEDAQSAVNGMYAQMRNVANSIYLYGDWRGDHTEQTDLGTGSDVIRNELKDDVGGTDWGAFYALINDANLIIRLVPDIEFVDEGKKNDLLAQAYFVRAWAYYQVVRIWGDAPLLTEGFLSPDQEGIVPGQRDPAAQIFSQVKADLESALDHFAGDGISSRYAVSKPAANTLKADVYLWTAKREGGGAADLNTALEAVNQVIGHPDLELAPFTALFRTTTATGADILSMYRDVIEPGYQPWYRNYMLQIQNYVSLSDEDKARIPLMVGGARFYAPTQILKDQFAENAALGNGQEDIRLPITVLDYDFNNEQRAHLVKFIGDPGIEANEYTDDHKLYRYADAILMRAEIQNALGKPDDAVADLNMTRNRAGIGDYEGGMSQEEVDDAILLERAVEFAFEAKRWWDLVRFDKAYELVPSLIGREGEQPILWPISQNTMALNPNLQQTPGY